MKRTVPIVLSLLALISCSRSHKALLPSISGKAGEVLVVIDKNAWEGSVGNATRDLLACDCPWFLMREPLYTLANVTPNGFGDIFKVHRNIVIFDISPMVAESGVKFLQDAWATPQAIVKVSAPDDETAVNLFNENGSKITAFIEQAERDRVIRNTLRYEERSLAPKVNKIFGGYLHFPTGFQFKKQASDFIWIADEKQYTIQGVFVYRFPAVGNDADFSKENLIFNRNDILQRNVPGMFENTYMTTAKIPEPTVEFIKYRDRNFAQLRGYWDVVNDYMGGPFVSHAFYSPDGQYVVVCEAFVYAPKYDKRQYLRQTESLLYSWEWAKPADDAAADAN